MTNPTTKLVKKGIEEFEKEFGSFEEYKKNVDADTVPNKESLELHDARLRLYMRLKYFLTTLISQSYEAGKKEGREETLKSMSDDNFRFQIIQAGCPECGEDLCNCGSASALLSRAYKKLLSTP